MKNQSSKLIFDANYEYQDFYFDIFIYQKWLGHRQPLFIGTQENEEQASYEKEKVLDVIFYRQELDF